MNLRGISAEQLIQLLHLQPHPEGGWYRETWRAAADDNRRASGSAILFLLIESEPTKWHRVDAAEIWHFYLGAPVELRTGPPPQDVTVHFLGPNISVGQRPQILIAPGTWQQARSIGHVSLVGCTVSPA